MLPEDLAGDKHTPGESALQDRTREARALPRGGESRGQLSFGRYREDLPLRRKALGAICFMNKSSPGAAACVPAGSQLSIPCFKGLFFNFLFYWLANHRNLKVEEA